MKTDSGMAWRHEGGGDGNGGGPVSKETALTQLLKELHEDGEMQALWNAASFDEEECLRQLHALVAQADRGGMGVKVELVVDRVLKAQPDAALFWVYKSALRMAARDWKEALAAGRRATELDPRDADAWLNMGIAAYELGLHEDCEKYLRVSYELNPRPKTLMEIGICQYHTGNRASGLQLLEMAWQKASADPEMAETYGWHLYYAGLRERALSILEEAVAFWPTTHPKIRIFAALSASAIGFKDKAARLMEPLLPDLYSGKLRRDLVGHALLALLQTDQIESGLRVVTSYKDHPGMNDVFYYNAACVMCLTRKLKDARVYLKKALDQDTGWVRDHMKTDPDLQDLRDSDPGLFSDNA